MSAAAKSRSWDAPEEIGFVAPVTGGGFIAGMKSGLHRFDPATGSFALITLVDSHRPGNRLNDGYVDQAGRLWFGSMDNAETQPTGSLYRFDREGLKCCDPGYVITNGPGSMPGWPDAVPHRYAGTSHLRLRPARRCSSEESSRLCAHRKPGAYPDGPVVDAEGCVWIALFGGWGLQRFSPRGELLQTVRLPVANCTKAAFGGDDRRTLYVTTAWKGLSDEQRGLQPLAGGLFRLRVDTPGLPQNEVTDCW